MHNLQKNLRRAAGLIGLGALLALSGCATIVGEHTQRIPIKSNPAGAHIRISDEAGRDVYRGITPAEVALSKSTGKYWGGKGYYVSITKEGHYGRNLTIVARPNGWYLAGNLIFGGAIGWFLIDPWNGKMYALAPDGIEADLERIISGAHMVPARPPPPTPAPIPEAADAAALAPAASEPAPVSPAPSPTPVTPAPEAAVAAPSPIAADSASNPAPTAPAETASASPLPAEAPAALEPAPPIAPPPPPTVPR